MNILMTSVHFYPHIGGIEIVTENLAREFVTLGHSVTVVTTTPDSLSGSKRFSFDVLRNPSAYESWVAYKKCDIFVHQGISLKWVWPLLLNRRPWIIVYHQVHFQKGILGYIKRACSYFAYSIAVSETAKRGCGLKNAKVIYNSYDDGIFYMRNDCERQNFVFVGRISKEKGCYVLLDAFSKYKKSVDNNSQLTLIGDSDEKQAIETYARDLPCSNDIHFLGFKEPCEIAKILNKHKVLIVPSTFPYVEAFGLVVLEGLACGCIVIGSTGNGIEEALNNCGYTFINGNSEKLAECMLHVDNLSEGQLQKIKEKSFCWLQQRTLNEVAKAYISEFNKYVS